MSYLSECRVHWRGLTAASVGLAVGYTFTNYVTNIFSPHLIRDLGWDKSDFALLGLIVVVAAVCQPVAGRLVDRFGVRRMALVGVVCAPLLFLALSRMTGPFWQFYIINILQVILVGGTTSAVVYTRLIADRFSAARGFALGIAACAPAVAGAAFAPVMAMMVEGVGWRAGYVIVAAFVALFGMVAIALIPKDAPQGTRGRRVEGGPAAGVYGEILRNRTFQLIIAGMLLCNLTLTMQMTQINIVLMDKGIGMGVSSFMISLYAGGVIAGRLLCGIALDRYPAHIVSALTMAAPAIGLFLLASDISSLWVAGFAVAVLGVATGAEGDVGAFLVMQRFRSQIYGTVFGLVMGALALSGALGAVLLSTTLAMTDGFTIFLLLSGGAAICGGLLFFLMGPAEPGTVTHEVAPAH